MSRRRGVVVSDDEDTSHPSRTPAPARTTASSRSVSSRKEPRASTAVPEPPAPDLPSVAKLSPEEVQKVRLLLADIQPLRGILTSAMAIVSDAAVTVEELPVSTKNTEVSACCSPFLSCCMVD